LDPQVSIIMSVYNGEEFLEQSIRSILTQEFRDFEFIIVDDGSSDQSENIILSFDDPRICYISNGKNKGLIYSLNMAIARAKGKYIARIDADDLSEPTRLSRQTAFMETHPDVALCGTYYRIINRKGEIKELVRLPIHDRAIRTYLLFGNCFCHSSVMVKTTVIREYGYSEDYPVCEDYDLWFRIALRHKVANLPFYETRYRIHGENISTKKRDLMLKCVSQIHSRALHQLSMVYEKKELILHNAILGFDHKKCLQFGINEVKNWLSRFSDHIIKNPEIDQDLAMKVIARRWVIICYNSGNYWLLINNPLFRKHTVKYLLSTGEKLLDKSLNRNRGLDL
jgi:glycosyltransferase involved in cell wall biosynthesis